jgi:asparagine synthase (glutamine-hydrolysing)
MCGITGYFSRENRYPIEEMVNILSHRGPDEKSHITNGNCTLGVTRLSINDLENGSMPISNENGTVYVVQNGEIYNSPSLRAELKKLGHSFRTRSDTEVLVHGYEEWGRDVIKRVQGIFAFAVYDTQSQELLLARDRLGIKPLYIHQSDKEIIFGSEAKAIVKSGKSRFDINPTALLERFIFGHPISYFSILEGIEQLPPGCFATFDANGVYEVNKYDSPVQIRHEIDYLDALEMTKRTIERVIQKQMLSDVPIGVWLSGGIDSCGLAYVLSQSQKTQIHTFTVADTMNHHEIKYANIMANLIVSNHSVSLIGEKEGIDSLPRYIWNLEDIDYNHMMLYLLAGAVKGKAKCIMSGHGADELFLGYGMYRNPGAYGNNILSRLSRSRNTLDGDKFSHFREIAQSFIDVDGLESMIKFNQVFELPNDNLNLVDRLSMAHGIEVRVPFLDEELVTLTNSMPSEYLLNGNRDKLILRDALRELGVPEVIYTRPKNMAGRKTIPKVMATIEAFADEMVPDSYVASHPFMQLLDYEDLMLAFEGNQKINSKAKLKSYILSFDLLRSIFVDNGADEPTPDILQNLY